MGACGINGQFCSDNWKETVNKLKKSAEESAISYRGNYDDACYSGDINTIYSFALKTMHNDTEREIWKYIESMGDRLDKRCGIIVEGGLIGYGVYVPTFTNSSVTIFQKLDFKGCPNILCREIISGNKAEILPTSKVGTQAELKEYVSNLLTDEKHLDDRYYIVSKTHKAIKCYNNQSVKKSTPLKTAKGICVVRPMYKYYWAGIAAC